MCQSIAFLSSLNFPSSYYNPRQECSQDFENGGTTLDKIITMAAKLPTFLTLVINGANLVQFVLQMRNNGREAAENLKISKKKFLIIPLCPLATHVFIFTFESLQFYEVYQSGPFMQTCILTRQHILYRGFLQILG